ncbi:Antitoxin SocA [Commensalibacter sp. Nvir]|uniref:Panacea domain-containing protein n=1 Tax=Commensalibacter sp. Nvir TaxID=3069817 RepID=UPI002D339127|nr:Antitoxin SocA [Commensalibacter sp. Nvir]
MPYNDECVANCILEKAFNEKRSDLTPMKLQKMLFFLNGWGLAITHEPVVEGKFEAWPYGPVIAELYSKTKRFGKKTIDSYFVTEDNVYIVSRTQKQFYDLLDKVWKKYINCSAYQLSEITHEVDSPWWITKKEGHKIIKDDIIKQYFVDLASFKR